jgi:hypothetical protein
VAAANRLGALITVGAVACSGGEMMVDDFTLPGTTLSLDRRADDPVDAGARDPADLAPKRDGSDLATEDAIRPCSGTNPAAGCTVSLVLNPSFDHGAGSWKAEPLAQQAFTTADWEHRADSGSLAVTNANVDVTSPGLTATGSVQCVRVLGAGYRLGARTFIAEDQGSGAAGVGLLFFDTLDCSGRTSGVFAGPTTTTAGAWVAVTGDTPAPSSARSLLMRLLVQKPFAQSMVTAQFDDVLLQTR